MLVLILAAFGITATTVTINPHAYQYQGSSILGAGNSRIVWEFDPDTLAPSTALDTCYDSDSLLSTGWLQIGWYESDDSTGVLPSSPSRVWDDQLTFHGINKFFLQVRLDTTTGLTNADTTTYEDWVAQTDATAKDSLGYESIRVEYCETQDDSTNDFEIWLADSTNILSVSGAASHDFYGYYKFENLYKMPFATWRGRWYSFPVRVIPGSHIRFIIESDNSLTEKVIVHWRVVGIKG